MTAALDGLVREYRHVCAELAAAEQDGPDWSPIEAARQDFRAVQVAREIADLLAAQTAALPADVPALV